MNRDETIIVLKILKSAYLSWYANLTRAQANDMIWLWSEGFKDNVFETVKNAVLKYTFNDKTGYPPKIGQIKELIEIYYQTNQHKRTAIAESKPINLQIDNMPGAVGAISDRVLENIGKSSEDYIGEDGLLYCYKCKSPKQCRIIWMGKEATPYCLCECEKKRNKKDSISNSYPNKNSSNNER